MSKNSKKPGYVSRRLGGNISFHQVKEANVLQRIDELCKMKRLSDVIECLLKLLYDDPTQFSPENNYRELLKVIEETGSTPNAKEYYDHGKAEIADMKRKVNEIYAMTLEMYTMARFNKTFGLEKSSENSARATFLLERQINKMCETLGFEDYTPFESAKLLDVDKKSEDILEHIIYKYSGVVNEIVSEQHQPVPVQVQAPFGQQGGTLGNSQNVQIAAEKPQENTKTMFKPVEVDKQEKQIEDKSNKTMALNIPTENNNSGDDDFIDFGIDAETLGAMDTLFKGM